MASDDHQTHEERMQLWAFRKLIVYVLGTLSSFALLIPISGNLAGKSTSLTVNIALAFSLVATLSLAVTIPGWVLAHKGKGKEISKVQALERELEKVRGDLEDLKAGQPTLESGADRPQEDENR